MAGLWLRADHSVYVQPGDGAADPVWPGSVQHNESDAGNVDLFFPGIVRWVWDWQCGWAPSSWGEGEYPGLRRRIKIQGVSGNWGPGSCWKLLRVASHLFVWR